MATPSPATPAPIPSPPPRSPWPSTGRRIHSTAVPPPASQPGQAVGEAVPRVRLAAGIARLEPGREIQALLRVALAVPLLAIGLGTASAAARVGPATPLCAAGGVSASRRHRGRARRRTRAAPVRRASTPPTITALAVLQSSGIEDVTVVAAVASAKPSARSTTSPSTIPRCLADVRLVLGVLHLARRRRLGELATGGFEHDDERR